MVSVQIDCECAGQDDDGCVIIAFIVAQGQLQRPSRQVSEKPDL
jgi:hypothetical protein